ncbi:hypothetical protein [Leminorella grimontii]|uniref:hypothetical protein n=1 Tax=Leminorella grimontii TaxID=82981 RepID=UPI00208A3B75|nr:hypothetical protein [Leminorella grimontii]GKX58612.1 hypothetical protein SOASR031_09270 [Leminorella grimontii]
MRWINILITAAIVFGGVSLYYNKQNKETVATVSQEAFSYSRICYFLSKISYRVAAEKLTAADLPAFKTSYGNIFQRGDKEISDLMDEAFQFALENKGSPDELAYKYFMMCTANAEITQLKRYHQ